MTDSDINIDSAYLNDFDPDKTTRDWALGITTPDANDTITGRATSRQVGGDGQYVKYGALDPDYNPLGWLAFDAGDHHMSLYLATDEKGNITSGPKKALDVPFEDRLRWKFKRTHQIDIDGRHIDGHPKLAMIPSRGNGGQIRFFDNRARRRWRIMHNRHDESLRFYSDRMNGDLMRMREDGSIDMYQNETENVVWEHGGYRPRNPETGQRFFDTKVGQPIWYDGNAWVDADGDRV